MPCANNSMDENPLRALILIALELIRQFEEQTGVTLPEGAMMWPLHPEGEPFPTATDGAPLYPTRELGGTAGLYRWLAGQDLGEVVFANDLSWTVHGVDAVLRDRRTGRYILCEAKGTGRPIADSPLSYLRRTRTKGRQLSWMWCWRSLADCALTATTAPLFLGLLSPFLGGQVERLLVVTRLGRDGEGWTVGDARAWTEAHLATFPELAAPYDLDRHRRWLADLAAEETL